MFQSFSTEFGNVHTKLDRLIGNMLIEISSMARDASSDTLSKRNAISALQAFTDGSERSRGPWNVSEPAPLLLDLAGLHNVLARGNAAQSQAQRMERHFGQEVLSLQMHLQRQAHDLGVYHQKHQASHWQRHTTERRQALLSLDEQWWKIREALDRYLDEAKQEVVAFKDTLGTLSSYERCAAGHADLVSSYTMAMMTMQRSHTVLRATWHKAANAFGQLAAVITDADVLQTFVRDEGCDSSLLEQTGSQVASAISSFSMLFSRFKDAGLTVPDTSTVDQSMKDILAMHKEALQNC